LVEGVQTNKTMESIYRKYEDDPENLPRCGEQFDEVMSYIGEIYPSGEMAPTNWKRIQLFYTLFTTLAHGLYGLKNLEDVDRPPVKKNLVGKLRNEFDNISLFYDQYTKIKDQNDVPPNYRVFIDFARRGTTDTAARIGRTKFICERLIEEL